MNRTLSPHRALLAGALVLASLGCSRSSSTAPPPPPPTVFTDDDREAVVDQTLVRALVHAAIPDLSRLLSQNPPIVLSNENIGDAPRGVPGFSIGVMTPAEIQQRADQTQQPFLFLRFRPVEVINGDTVLVRLDNIWVIPIGQTIGVTSGGGITVRYTRSASGWVGEIVGSWIA